MICPGCPRNLLDLLNTDDWHSACLKNFKDEVYQLFGFHPSTRPNLIYEDILHWREQDRQVSKIPKNSTS